MACSFKRGVVRVSADEELDWAEVAARLALARELGAVVVSFQRARREGDCWIVPFLSAEGNQRPDSADIMLEKYTPYEVPEAERVDVLTASLEELEIMLGLVRGTSPDVSAKRLAPEEPTTEPEHVDPESVFDGLVGMDEQKEMLIKLSTALAKHGRSAVECFHFVFVGNPGTGKTELASRLVSYLDSLGVTDGTHKMVKVSGSELMADYVGQTGNKVRRIVDSAVGGMLFVDEFYGLSVKDAGGYGHEAIDALTERLRTSKDFSNARSVRRLVDHAVVEASVDHDEAVITEKDLLAALPQCLTKSKVRRAGF